MQSPRAGQAHLIRAGRLSLGMTQQELARRLGVHVQTIAHFESGRKQATGKDLITAMADLFGYDPDDFYYAAGRMPPDMQAYIARQPRLMKRIRKVMQEGAPSDP